MLSRIVCSEAWLIVATTPMYVVFELSINIRLALSVVGVGAAVAGVGSMVERMITICGWDVDECRNV